MNTDELLGAARDRANDMKDAAYDRVSESQERVIEFTQEKPILALLSALVIGILIGKLVL